MIKIKMDFAKNKKGEEGAVSSVALIIAFVLAFALLAFVLYMYSGIGTKLIQFGKPFFK